MVIEIRTVVAVGTAKGNDWTEAQGNFSGVMETVFILFWAIVTKYTCTHTIIKKY